MGDAAREDADAFQSLGADELQFKPAVFRYIGIDGENALGIARVVADEAPASLDDEFAAGLILSRGFNRRSVLS